MSSVAAIERAVELTTIQDINANAAAFVPVENYAVHAFPRAFVDMDQTLQRVLDPYVGIEEFDVTAFYSRRKILSRRQTVKLLRAEAATYDRVRSMGGLVVYKDGELIEPPENVIVDPELELDFVPTGMSFCMSITNAHARAGADSKPHRSAASRTKDWYEEYQIRKYKVIRNLGELAESRTDSGLSIVRRRDLEPSI